MAAGPDISSLSHAQKDALIASLMGQVAALTADSDEAARVKRDNAARGYEMMPPTVTE